MLPAMATAIPRHVGIAARQVTRGEAVLRTRRQSRCGLWQRWWGGRRAQRVVTWWRGEMGVYTCRVAAAANFAIVVEVIGDIAEVVAQGSTSEHTREFETTVQPVFAAIHARSGARG